MCYVKTKEVQETSSERIEIEKKKQQRKIQTFKSPPHTHTHKRKKKSGIVFWDIRKILSSSCAGGDKTFQNHERNIS